MHVFADITESDIILSMPRKRPPNRLDQIADSATEVFIQQGFGQARIAEIAARSRVGPGTIYLYADSKDALYDLALRRSLEDPTLWELTLPHPAPDPGAVADAAWRCIQNAAHFPRLWLAADSSAPPAGISAEVDNILGELYGWLHRYRRAIKLIERSARDWPDVAQVFYRRFWRGGVRRVADYLGRRMEEGVLPRRTDPTAAAHMVAEVLTWAAVHRYWADGVSVSEDDVTMTIQPMLRSALMGSA